MQCEACGEANAEGARFCARCGAILPSGPKGPDPLIGQILGGRFRVTGVIGEGGMGVVYQGEQQLGSSVRKVAIKTLHQHLSKDPSVLARFHREVGTVAELEHPNTIKVYDFGTTGDGTLYIAMEFVAGKPLSDVIRDDHRLNADRVVKILRQVCGALDEAHNKGIIHRDLKPENVILTNRAGETDFVKVLDFGIAARSESADAQKEAKLTQQGMVLGTPPYMSPEQFTGKALDARSDVYSLGVMAYEMLTGRLPFDADTPWQWATQHMTAQPMAFEVAAPTSTIPSNLRGSVMRALSKDREQRQSSAREFFDELSGGGRITVEGGPPTAAQTTGTASMDAVPDFGAPAPMPMHVARAAAPTPGPAVANIPHQYGGVQRPPKGGGKGLLIGLGILGVVLLSAMAVVAARSLGSSTEYQPEIALGAPTDTAAPTAAGTATAPATATTFAPLETPPPDPGPVASTTTPTPTEAAGGKTGTTPKPPQQQPAGGGCDACLSQVSAKNYQAAARSFQSCNDDAKKVACRVALQRVAYPEARDAANLGDCKKAQAIIAAASAMGAASKRLQSVLDTPSCKK
jgi:tRNA A-37 threonylcarbamoyl transferase component Bud32